MKQIFISISISLLFTGSIKAQYIYASNMPDNDSIKCLMDISVYKEFQEMKLYKEAIEAWTKAYANCPGFKKILYQDGVKFLHYLIAQEHDKSIKTQLIDSLMHIYDTRIKYFGQEGYVLGRKGIDLYRYDKSRADEIRSLLIKSIEKRGEKSDPQVLLVLMYSTEMLFNEQKIEKTDVSKTYYRSIELLDGKLKIEKDTKQIRRINIVKEQIEVIVNKGHFANCDVLEEILERNFIGDSNNVELLVRIQSLLKSTNCLHSDLYYRIALQLDSIQPSPANSYLLGGFSLKQEQTNKAVFYLKNAIKQEKSDSLKANYCVDLGTVYYTRLKDFVKARDYAKKAVKLNPASGKAYILLGDIYAAYSPKYGKNKFEHSTLYWLAVDQYIKAKETEISLSKTAEEKIAYYKGQFPNLENAFFYGYSKGQIYKFDDWIKETTIVR